MVLGDTGVEMWVSSALEWSQLLVSAGGFLGQTQFPGRAAHTQLKSLSYLGGIHVYMLKRSSWLCSRFMGAAIAPISVLFQDGKTERILFEV